MKLNRIIGMFLLGMPLAMQSTGKGCANKIR